MIRMAGQNSNTPERLLSEAQDAPENARIANAPEVMMINRWAS